VCAQLTAYSAKLPAGAMIWWNAATRSPGLNSTTFDPTACTTPAMSSPEFNDAPDHSGRFQSLGLEPETTTFVTTWSASGVGMGESMILTFGPLETIASFILEEIVGEISLRDAVEKVRVADVRRNDIDC